QLPPDDQVALLRNPHAELSAELRNRLLARKVLVVGTQWAQQSPNGWMVDPSLARALHDIRRQFDQWWERRTEDERATLIENRNGELSADYREIVRAANDDPLEHDKPPVFAIVADNRTGRFRMPSILATYLELKARGDQIRRAAQFGATLSACVRLT